MKKGCIVTTVHIPKELRDEAKKRNFNISNFLTEQLEYEFYHENSKYIEKKLAKLDESTNNNDRERTLLLAQLEVAKKKEQTKKQRFSETGPPEVMTYRTSTPIKKKEDHSG